MTEATEMQFGGFTQVDPTNRVFSGDPDLLRGKKRIFLEGGDFPVLTSTLTQIRPCP